jgi:ABC-type nitrate/sulfonate/bicarbonate transport system substrate-binding protein
MTEQTGSKITRRRAMQGLAGGIGLAVAAAPFAKASAQSLTKVKITLPWFPEGNYAHVFVARAQKFWEKRGLDVEIARGYGSSPAAQNVFNKQFEFGIIGSSSVIQLAQQGITLVSLGITDYSASMGVAVLEDSPIRQPKDLEGKKIGGTISSVDYPFFKPFAEREKLDMGKMQMINLDAKVRARALMDRQIDALLGSASSIIPATVSVGHRIRYILYGNYGIDLYNNCLVTRPDYLEANPNICEAMVDGLMEAIAFVVRDQAEGQKIFLREVRELSMTESGPEYTRLGMEVFQFSLMSESTPKEKGLGWAETAKLEQMSDLISKYLVKDPGTQPDLSKLFTNRFVGKIKLSDAEWATARQRIDSTYKMLKPT